MSKRYFPWLIIVISLLTLISCDPPLPPPSPTATTAPTPTFIPEQGLNFLVSTTESIQLKRDNWSDYQPIAFGTTIRRGDLILPPSGEEVTILCADLSVHTIDQEAGSPCQVVSPKLYWDGTRIVNPMAAPIAIPYILYPRSTQIVDEQPWLRWHDTGAGSYTVSIIQGGEAIWQETGVAGTELHYPDNAPPLNSGVDYLLEVVDEDSGTSSTQDPLKGLGFRLSSSEAKTLITQTQNEIHTLSLDASAQSFALAIFYAGQGIYGDAQILLDEVAQTTNAPLVQLWRGHMFLATRLYAEAEDAYTEAATLATALDDIETQAQAQTGLWRAAREESHYDAAILLYQQLGDQQAISALQEEHQ